MTDTPDLPRLLQRLRAGEPALGVWSVLDSTATIEAISSLPVDWVTLDGEHGLIAAGACLPQLQAVRPPVTALVRLPAADPALAARVLDAGADGIVVPRVESAEQAAAMVAACRYPPAGRRGIGPHRAAGYGTRAADYLAHANERVAVVVQIESRAALERRAEIVGVEGLAAALIGPNDLAASLGRFGQLDHPEVEEAIGEVLAACRAAGLPAAIYCRSGADARARIAQGFAMVNVTSDLGALVRAVGMELDAARGDG
ncbi:MAG TPA: aldolase/citrate lyase family protein [Thermoanaerobaculia bacterium]|nr:aldolase/citrate lyase family protein [Thermoanaerobaculia bacterium]